MTSSAADTCALSAAPRIAALHTQAVQWHHAERGVQMQERVLASEVPIALVFNGIAQACPPAWMAWKCSWRLRHAALPA